MFCYKCGTQIDDNAKFCHSCGAPMTSSPAAQQAKGGIFDSLAQSIGNMTGDTQPVELKFKDVFSDVFRKHTQEETENIFISGTETTTPPEDQISETWPKPFLFVRVLAVMLITFFLLYVCVSAFENTNMLPGLLIIGSFAAPFSLLVFFWEINAPRNIAFYEVIKVFFIGGMISLFVSLVLFEFVTIEELGYGEAILVGVIEEVGKVVAVAFFLKKVKYKYIFNGMLIGAAVGAGFAAFESAGYAFNILLGYGYDMMLENLLLRGILAAGGHVAWAAITGAALAGVKGSGELSTECFTDGRFLKFLILVVVPHAVWDMPINLLPEIYFIPIVLTVAAWIVIFVLINRALKQIEKLHNEAVAASAADEIPVQ